MEIFRQEILETQKNRSELLKWKLIISASIASIALGAFGINNQNPPLPQNNQDNFGDLSICLIPFLCAYTDLLCYHLNLRMFVISYFFKKAKRQNKDLQKTVSGKINFDLLDVFSDYEEICGKVRSVFELESWALKWSSIFLSLMVIIPVYYAHDKLDAYWFLIAGVLGILMAWLTEGAYNIKSAELAKTLEDKENGNKSLDNPQIIFISKPTILIYKPKDFNTSNLLETRIKIIKWINLLFSLLLFGFGIFLIVKYIDLVKCNELVSNELVKLKCVDPGNITNDDKAILARLLLLPGILFLLTATLTEHAYRRTINLEKEKFLNQSQTPLFGEWIYFSVYTLIVPLIGFYLKKTRFYPLKIENKPPVIVDFESLGIFLLHIGIIVPIILVVASFLIFYLVKINHE